MGIREWLGGLLPFQQGGTAPQQTTKTGAMAGPRGLGGQRGRVSVDSPNELPFSHAFYITAPPTPLETWRAYDLNDKTLDRISTKQLMELLLDVSPEVSSALWHFIRFCNPGYEAAALQPNVDEQDETGQAALDEILSELKRLYGTVDVAINRLFLSAFLRGAFLGELVLDNNQFIDLATPDPWAVRFRKVLDPLRGIIWEMGQYQGSEWVALTADTIQYIPIDPLPGSPYGRPLISPAIFSTLFLIGLLHDLRRVVAQQGYPRLDLEVSLEKISDAMPINAADNPDTYEQWVNTTIDEVKSVYSTLEPDDAYIHTDVVTVNRPVGTMDSSSLGAVDGLIRGLERMATRALKTMPLLMGSNEAVSETHANRQWEIHVAGIKTIQHYCETLLENLLGQALQAQGIPARVQFRFAELRASEMLRDAQTETMRIANAGTKYDRGWISQDQASEEITGEPADVAEPRVSDTPGLGLIQDDGDGFGFEQNSRRRRAEPVAVEGADNPLPPEPEEVEISDVDREAAIRLWDELMPDYAGLLIATVIDGDETIPSEGETDWEYDVPRRRYRNTVTGETLNQRQITRLRNEFLEKQRDAGGRMNFLAAKIRGVEELADQITGGDITVQRWVLDMREEGKRAYLGQYMLARGGDTNMTQSDYGRVGRMLAPNGLYQRIQTLGEKAVNGELSAAQIRQQSRQLINSSTQAFERGRAASFGAPSLPQYPADGNQDCHDNCNCEWVIREFSDRWECTWKINPGQHCETCLGNAARWNPLVIMKDEGRGRKRLDRILEQNRNGH